MECCWCGLKLQLNLSNGKDKFQLLLKLYLFLSLLMCQSQSVVKSQRIDRLSCERRPTHTTALKTPGDNGFSIKILGSPPVEFYKPGHDYQVLLNGSYSNQQFLDFMLVAVLKKGDNERQTAGNFMHTFNHMTKEDAYCNHIMTSVTFHPSYKKSTASFMWTAPIKGSGCVLFKATVLEHPDIWFRDDGGLTKMFCEEPEEEVKKVDTESKETSSSQESTGHTRRQSSQCCACDVAKYELTFVGNWSRATHPKEFPSSQHESLLHWSDIIGASHSPSYSIWSYGSMATAGVKEVCEYGWPRTLEGEIKQQSRNVRTVITANGIWGYPNIYTTKRSARFSTDNTRPFVSLLTMVGPSPDWCIGIDSVNMCLDNCTWLDKIDLDLYPWDAGTDSGVTYLSSNLPTFPRAKIRPITNVYPNNTASPFYGEDTIKPMATVTIRRVGVRNPPNPNERCEANGNSLLSAIDGDGEEEDNLNTLNVKCMVTEWSGFSPCSVTCGVGTKTRTRQFKHPMGTLKMCPRLKLQEMDNCLGLVNKCEFNPDEPVDLCITTPWSAWSPCNVSCGSGSHIRTRQYLNQMGPLKCSTPLADRRTCEAEVVDCMKARMNTDWNSVCKQQVEIGSCVGNFTRFFYDMDMKKCRPFEFSGCRGNSNNFDTMGECQLLCGAVDEGGDVEIDEDGDVDCMVTEWTSFTQCTVSCGTGLRSRSRQIKRRNSGHGAACPKEMYDSRVCASKCTSQDNDDVENVDCMLSEWSLWSACSESCSDGVQTRLRMVKRPSQGQGQPCDSNRKQMKDCNMGDCYPLCMLSVWSGWTECSVACGVGKRMRRRMAKREPCSPDTKYTEAEPCSGQQCIGSDCVISEWSNWTDCDVMCGSMGTQTRFRMIIQPAINGGRCELDDPKQMEKRACYNGACTNLVTTTESLKDDKPVDCEVGEWGEWTTCSKTCGTGKQVRRRKMLHKRKNHGERCPPLKETKVCGARSRCRRRKYKRA